MAQYENQVFRLGNLSMRHGKEERCPRNKFLPAEVMVATSLLEHREERTRCMGKQSHISAQGQVWSVIVRQTLAVFTHDGRPAALQEGCEIKPLPQEMR